MDNDEARYTVAPSYGIVTFEDSTFMTQISSLWFLFHNGKLLLFDDGQGIPSIPCGPVPPIPASGMVHQIGLHDMMPCVAYSVDQVPNNMPCVPTDLRASYEILGALLYTLAGKGFQMIYWDKLSQYCSCCGAQTEMASGISKRCPCCEREIFPNIATAVLVLVRKEDSTLLVRAHTFRGTSFGLVAGFLEPGETLEECVHREVLEETALRLTNVSYFGSQPWPYPSGLMVGFIADYLDGEIVLQKEELSVAQFFKRDALPELPQPLSLARQMIDWWRES